METLSVLAFAISIVPVPRPDLNTTESPPATLAVAWSR